MALQKIRGATILNHTCFKYAVVVDSPYLGRKARYFFSRFNNLYSTFCQEVEK